MKRKHKTRGEVQAAASEKDTLTTIAGRIRDHLDDFEKKDEKKSRPNSRRSFWNATAYRAGPYVNVVYVSFQGPSSLTREEAEAYLKWLDAGNMTRHFECPIVEEMIDKRIKESNERKIERYQHRIEPVKDAAG